MEERKTSVVEVSDFVEYDKNKYIYKLIPKENIAVFLLKSLFYAMDAEVNFWEDIICDFWAVTEKSTEISDKVFDLLEKDGYHNYTCDDPDGI